MFAGGTSELGTMRCCSVQRTDTKDVSSRLMNRRATERSSATEGCRDRAGVGGAELAGTGSAEKTVAELAA
jgi:hypothetical protein